MNNNTTSTSSALAAHLKQKTKDYFTEEVV